MAVELLQLDSNHDNYEIEVLLDGENFRLACRWNERVDAWFVSLYDASGDAIALGRRLTVGNFLFPWLVGSNRPAGQLMALDTSNEDVDPAHADLGNRVIVTYLDAEEMAGIVDA